MKNLIKIIFTLTFLFPSVILAAIESSTFTVKKPYMKVKSWLEPELLQRFSKKAGLFNSGIKIVVDEIDSTTVYHFKIYQMTGQIVGDLGSIVLSKQSSNTLIVVENNPYTFDNLHLNENMKNWLQNFTQS